MNKEQLFAKALEELNKTARAQGNMIRQEQLDACFAALSLTKEQNAMLLEYLKQRGIGIGEPLSQEEYLSNEEIDYLKAYQESLALLPTATDGEKQAAFLSAMAGEKDAQRRLTEIFLPQIPEFAKLYANQGVLLDDLIGQGNMALSEGVTMLNAMENATEAEGMLVKMVLDSMEELVSGNFEAKKIDDKVVKKVNEIADKAHDLAEDLRRKVTISELAEELGISEKSIRDAYRMSGFAIEDIDKGAADEVDGVQ
ncbi:MAG: hypothetical protein K6G23_00450 [Lachnospiraceae bacterium]|nr:hypothetical protein [Lachnospiraceae bacterium]